MLIRAKIGFDNCSPLEFAAAIKVEVDPKNKNVIGYANFCSEFYFDAEGSLVKMGVWE
jgi:hypothetical protein